ncbi:hypothetical protein M9458_046246, partial [Cirrhinus mrigala]
NGIVILVDYAGVGLSQASNPGPLLAKKVVSILQDGFPIRIKAVNIINEPRIFKGIFAIIKPFLKEKMAERYVLHGSDLASLHRVIPQSVLPQELDMSAWSRTLLEAEEEFVVEASLCQTPCCLTESKLAHMERTPSDIYVPSFIIATDLLAT